MSIDSFKVGWPIDSIRFQPKFWWKIMCSSRGSSVTLPIHSAMAPASSPSPLLLVGCGRWVSSLGFLGLFLRQHVVHSLRSIIFFCRLLHENFSILPLHDWQLLRWLSFLPGLFLERWAEMALFDECLFKASLAISFASMNDTVSSIVLKSSPAQPRTSRLTSSSARPDINTSFAMISVKSTDRLQSTPGQSTLYWQVAAFPFILAKNDRTLSPSHCCTANRFERRTLIATGMTANRLMAVMRSFSVLETMFGSPRSRLLPRISSQHLSSCWVTSCGVSWVPRLKRSQRALNAFQVSSVDSDDIDGLDSLGVFCLAWLGAAAPMWMLLWTFRRAAAMTGSTSPVVYSQSAIGQAIEGIVFRLVDTK